MKVATSDVAALTADALVMATALVGFCFEKSKTTAGPNPSPLVNNSSVTDLPVGAVFAILTHPSTIHHPPSAGSPSLNTTPFFLKDRSLVFQAKERNGSAGASANKGRPRKNISGFQTGMKEL